MNKKIVDVNNVKNLNDFKLLQIGWIFDISFEQTLHAVKSRKYLEMLCEVLPSSGRIEKIFNVIQKHLDYQFMPEIM